MVVLVICIFLAAIVGAISADKSVGGWGGLILSLLLSLIIELIIAFISVPRSEIKKCTINWLIFSMLRLKNTAKNF